MDNEASVIAGGGVGVGTNNPGDLLHPSLPPGDAMRVQIGGQTRFRIHDNGGVSIDVNADPPSDGLLVPGDIRCEQPPTRSSSISAAAFKPLSKGNTAEPEFCREWRAGDRSMPRMHPGPGIQRRGFLGSGADRTDRRRPDAHRQPLRRPGGILARSQRPGLYRSAVWRPLPSERAQVRGDPARTNGMIGVCRFRPEDRTAPAGVPRHYSASSSPAVTTVANSANP